MILINDQDPIVKHQLSRLIMQDVSAYSNKEWFPEYLKSFKKFKSEHVAH